MRLSIPLLTIVASVIQAPTCDACCLSDWLCGRNNAPYVVGYVPYTAAYAPVTTTTVVETQPYAAAYAPVPAPSLPTIATATPAPTLSAQPVGNVVPAVNNGVYQAQRPAYYQNPSVYTGLPVTGNAQAAYRVPITSTLRGVSPTATAYQSAYASGYAGSVSPGQPITVTTPTGSPATAIPVAPVAPVFAAPAQPSTGGLGRFFGGHLGTGYRSSYYRTPITYYRPVTSIDPVTGTTVTVQRPCTSSVQQLQRTPLSTVRVGQPAMVQPSTGCHTSPAGGCASTPYGTTSPYAQTAPPSQLSPYASPPTNGIGQVGAIGPGGQLSPIPSTAPAPNGYYAQPAYAPSTAPVTGAPLSGAPLRGAPPASMLPRSGDQSPVDQPSLNNGAPQATFRRETTESSDGTPSNSPNGLPSKSSDESSNDRQRSYWELQDAEDSTAMIHPSTRPADVQRDPASLSNSDFTRAEPIQAPDDYESPFRNRIQAPATPVRQQTLEAPPLPPSRTFDPSDATSVSNRVSVPVREAALSRTRVFHQPAQPTRRDTTWYPINP